MILLEFSLNFFILLYIVFYFFSFLKFSQPKTIRFIGLIILALIIKEIFYLFLNNNLIVILFDFIVISLYLFWLRFYTGKKHIDLFFFIPNFFIILFIVINSYYNIFFIKEIYLNLWLIVDVICLYAFLLQVSEYNTENSIIIIRTRTTIAIVLIFQNIVLMLFGYTKPVTQLVVPFCYFLHFYIIYNYYVLFGKEKDARSEYFFSSIEYLFSFMKNFGAAIVNNEKFLKSLELIVESAVRNINADAGVILMLDETGSELHVKAINGIFPPFYPVKDIIKKDPNTMKNYFKKTSIKVGDTILGECAKTGKTILIKKVYDDKRMKDNISHDLLFVSSVVVIPLKILDRIIGVLSIIKREDGQFFNEKDVEHLEVFSEYSSIVIVNMMTSIELIKKYEIEKEIEIAEKIQTAIVPMPPEHPELQIAALMIPADEVGGDYYDILFDNQKKIWFAIGDVSGHGVTSGLIMMMAQSSFSSIIKAFKDISPKEAIVRVNRLLCENIRSRLKENHFMTMNFLKYLGKGNFIHAGYHLDIIVYRNKEKKCELIKTRGMFLGVNSDISNAAFNSKFFLDKGDIMLLYTDGIVEAMHKSTRACMGIDRLQKIIVKNSHYDLEVITEEIKEEVLDWSGNKLNDDITMVLVKRK